MRFMGSMKQAPAKFVEGLCSEDLRDRACLLAVMGEEPEARVVGFGNYVSLGVRNTADVAFIVADEFQGRGISTLLLERLAGIAAGVGFVAFEADVLFENQPMTNVLRDSGFEGRQVMDGGNFHVEFPVAGAAAVRERAELRERTAHGQLDGAPAAPARRRRGRRVARPDQRRQSDLPAHPGEQLHRHRVSGQQPGGVGPRGAGVPQRRRAARAARPRRGRRSGGGCRPGGGGRGARRGEGADRRGLGLLRDRGRRRGAPAPPRGGGPLATARAWWGRTASASSTPTPRSA